MTTGGGPPGDGTVVITYTKATSTTTLGSSANPSTAGQAVTFTATVTGNSPTGTVNFKDGGTTIAGCGAQAVSGGSATCTTSALSAGSHSISAVYSGDSGNDGSTSSTLTQTVNQAASSTGLGSSLNPSTAGQSVTFTATVAGDSPSGTVDFKDGGTTIGGCGAQALSSGTATCTTSGLSAGSHSITGVYGGDTNNQASTSSTLTQTVNVAAPSLSTNASAGVVVGNPIHDTATLSNGSSPTGTITFKLYGQDDATCSNGAIFTTTKSVAGNGSYGSAAFTPIATGVYRWTATYSGDTNNNPASNACNAGGESVVVSKASPTLSSKAIANVAKAIRAEGTVAGGYMPGGTITFALYGPNTDCSGTPIFTDSAAVTANGAYESKTFAPTKAGSYRWAASYSGDANNAPASSPCTRAGVKFSICVIPRVKGLTLAAARRMIESSFCSVGRTVGHHFSRRVKKGHVLWQRWPKPGRVRPGGTPVHLVLSTGKPPRG